MQKISELNHFGYLRSKYICWVKYQRINYRPNEGSLKGKPAHDTEMKYFLYKSTRSP
jgi:hypothetical protein